MKTNKMTSYAFKIIRRIAMDSGAIVTSIYIAEKEQISHGVVMKVLSVLRKSGILISHQGRGENCGGFTLSRNLKDITVYDIITIMEGELSLCPNPNDNIIKSSTEDMFGKFGNINNTFIGVLKEYSLMDIVGTQMYLQ